MTVNLQALADQYGCPYYLYEEEIIARQLDLLRAALPDFQILYSVKTNPHPAIIRYLAAGGVGADAASSYEVERALAGGMAPGRIFYSAPGKTADQIAAALGRSTVIADSYTELRLLEALAAKRDGGGGDKLAVGLRINPCLSYGPGLYPELRGGVGGKFGVDEESLADNIELLRSFQNIRLSGIHVFLRSQVLSPQAIAAAFEAAFGAAAFLENRLGREMSFINFGGGLGLAPAADSPALDLAALSREVSALVKKYARPGQKLLLESGRFLVGEAGRFVTRVLDVKESRGKTYLIAPGGLSAFLRPSIMALLKRLGYDDGPLEPLFSDGRCHRLSLPGKDGAPKRKVTVAGNLCTALDVLAEEVELPEAAVGDLLVVSQAGAYGASLSPFAFGSFPRPPELYLGRDGRIEAA